MGNFMTGIALFILVNIAIRIFGGPGWAAYGFAYLAAMQIWYERSED